jgi:hypothetical protein
MTTDEMIAALNAKVLDIEKELTGLKGRDHSALAKELEALKDKVEALTAARPATPTPAPKKEIEKDELAEMLGD